MSKYTIFCDFDGTITKQDTLNELMRIYGNSNWLEIEKLWLERKIGSKECLIRQMECIDDISKPELTNFINKIKIDDYFINFLETANKNKIEMNIVSDGFDIIIDSILKNNNINNIKVFSNKLKLQNGKLLPSFPYNNPECSVKSGLCKCNSIKNNSNKKQIIYIGDGISDICASKHADILFAKGNLADYCSQQGIDFTKFETFNEIGKFLIKGDIFNAKNRGTVR